MASDTNEKQSDSGRVQAQHVEEEARDVDMRINLGWRSWVGHTLTIQSSCLVVISDN